MEWVDEFELRDFKLRFPTRSLKGLNRDTRG